MKLATMLGGLLLSRGGRRMAGRNAGKLALAGLAWKLFQNSRQLKHARSAPRPAARTRWSGRRPH